MVSCYDVMMRQVWLTLGSYGILALGGCAASRPASFKPDIIVHGPPGHPPGQYTHRKREFWDALDPFLPPDEGGGPPPSLPGLASPETKKTSSPDFVVPDADLIFGRAQGGEQKP